MPSLIIRDRVFPSIVRLLGSRQLFPVGRPVREANHVRQVCHADPWNSILFPEFRGKEGNREKNSAGKQNLHGLKLAFEKWDPTAQYQWIDPWKKLRLFEYFWILSSRSQVFGYEYISKLSKLSFSMKRELKIYLDLEELTIQRNNDRPVTRATFYTRRQFR